MNVFFMVNYEQFPKDTFVDAIHKPLFLFVLNTFC